MRWLALACAAVGCSFTHGALGPDDSGGNGGDASDDNGSDARPIDARPTDATDADTRTIRGKTITVTGAVTGTLNDFQMWIHLVDTQIGNRARTDGTDIFFTNTAGTPLPFERQSWNKTTGTLDAWVRVPSVATGTQIQVRYGDVTQASTPSSATVFTGYLAVYHLDDTLANATITDARGQFNGTAQGLASGDHVTGQLGSAIDFNGGTAQISFTNPLTGTGSHTISLWVNQRTTTTNDAMIVLGTGATNQARWFHSRFNAATVAVGFYGNDWANPAEDIQGDNWTLLHWVYDSSNRNSTIYRDGALVAGPNQHSTGVNTQGTTGVIGNADGAFGTNMGILATLDEVRITGALRSAAWIAAEALNQKTPSAFYTVGVEFIP